MSNKKTEKAEKIEQKRTSATNLEKTLASGLAFVENGCYSRIACKVYYANGNYSVVFNGVDKNARITATCSKNGGIDYHFDCVGAKLNGKNGVASFRTSQIENNKDVDIATMRNITRGLTFAEFISIVIQCCKSDGSSRYQIVDISDNAKLMSKYYLA